MKRFDIREHAGPLLDEAFKLAADNGHLLVARWLAWYERRVMSCSDTFHIAIFNGHLEGVKSLAPHRRYEQKEYERGMSTATSGATWIL